MLESTPHFRFPNICFIYLSAPYLMHIYLRVLFLTAGFNYLSLNNDLPVLFLFLLFKNLFYLIEVWLILLSLGLHLHRISCSILSLSLSVLFWPGMHASSNLPIKDVFHHNISHFLKKWALLFYTAPSSFYKNVLYSPHFTLK